MDLKYLIPQDQGYFIIQLICNLCDYKPGGSRANYIRIFPKYYYVTSESAQAKKIIW